MGHWVLHINDEFMIPMDAYGSIEDLIHDAVSDFKVSLEKYTEAEGVQIIYCDCGNIEHCSTAHASYHA